MALRERILEQFLSELSKSSDHTRQDRSFYAEKFLSFAGDKPLSEWNNAVVNDFLAQLASEGYAPGTIRKVYGIVKRVFDAAKSVYEGERTRLISEVNPNDKGAVAQILQALSLPPPTWDMGKRSAPRVETEDMVKPASTLEEIRAMVEAARSGKLSDAEIAYLALSSVYGLRREELCRVRKEHLDFDMKRIYVLTAKGGEKRYQLLCDEVIPFLKGYDFPAYTVGRMSELYYRICYKAGVEHKEGGGWHSPRRFLDTELVKLFGELDAHIFLRWKLSSSSLMVERYYSEDPLEVDRRVLERHPVVPLWR